MKDEHLLLDILGRKSKIAFILSLKRLIDLFIVCLRCMSLSCNLNEGLNDITEMLL